MADLPAKPSLDRTAGLARQADAFCEASIRDGTGRAARMLAATPELARYSFATAVILGDADRVRPSSAAIPASPPGPTPGQAGRRFTPSAPHAGTGSTRPGPGACWPWPGCCLTPAPTPTAAPVTRAGTAAGPRCAAPSPGRPARSSPLCCSSAARSPATTICTWPGSPTTTTSACGCSCSRPPMSPSSPGWRSPPRSASTTARECTCCWRPELTPAATPTTTARRHRPSMPPSRPAARPN